MNPLNNLHQPIVHPPAGYASGHQNVPQESAPPPSGRLMQIKILYNLNDDEKTNCLARIPQALPIQTATLDNGTQVGIIELRTCTQAIVSASPELVTKLGQDYTVYAYDYSEYETPLVGQGMLSWVLAAASATPTAPAFQSHTMVTGKVTRSGLSLFSSNGIKETLEVKLKLVPVPNAVQTEYVASMEKYRDTSNLGDQASSAAAWASFLQQTPSLRVSTGAGSPPDNSSPFALGPGDRFGPHTQNAYASPPNHVRSAPPVQRDAGSYFTFNQSDMAIADPNHPISRPGTPPVKKAQPRSRPASRNENRNASSKRRESFNAQETAPSKKRARVEKTKWQGPSAFDATESLRVAASTAASIRGHNTAGVHPSASAIANAEPGVRPPTPQPRGSMPVLNRSSTATGHDAITQKSQESRLASFMSSDAVDANETAYSSCASPDFNDGNEGSTPFDIPSSPPLMGKTSPTQSSPVFPRRVNDPDSGFASGTLDDCFDDDEMDQPNDDDTGTTSRYQDHRSACDSTIWSVERMRHSTGNQDRHVSSPTTSLAELRPNESENVPMLPAERPPQTQPQSEAQQGHQKEDSNFVASNTQSLTDMQNSPQTSEQMQQPEQTLQPGNDLPTIAPKIVEGSETYSTRKSQSLGSGLRRKKAIQKRMLADVQAGIMPPYCKHCGQIETPTWRKCYTRIEQGSPDGIVCSEEPGRITACDTFKRNESGEITSYRAIKRALSRLDHDYDEMQLCNPCGIWLSKNKQMRPAERFHGQESRAPKAGLRRRSKKPSDVKSGTNLEQDSHSNIEEMSPQDKAILAMGELMQNADDDEESIPSGRTDKSIPKSTGRSQRSASTGTKEQTSTSSSFLEQDAATAALLQKALKSSPPRFPGSKASPINIDGQGTPDQTRRLLFPSPRKAGEVKSLGESGDSPVRSGEKSKQCSSPSKTSQANKENLPAPIQSDDEDPSPSKRYALRTTPNSSPRKALTPRSTSSINHDPLKTPARSSASNKSTPHGLLTSAAKRFLNAPESPSRLLRRSPRSGASSRVSPFAKDLDAFFANLANQQSPSRNSTADVSVFNDEATPNLFTFEDFLPEGSEHRMPMPSSDGLFALCEDPKEPPSEFWPGPLMEGELDDLLREAGEDGYRFDMEMGSGTAETGGS